MKRYSALFFATILCLVTAACNKDEGTGGTSTIQGRIFKVMHPTDTYSLTADTVAAAKQDVFIVYGDDIYFGDDIETGEDGTYRFRYLTPGTYTVYAYSELASGERVAVSQTATIKRGQTLTLDDMYVHSGKAYGTSMVRGWLWATYFDKNGDIRSNWAYDQRVYIQRVDEDYAFDNVRVGLGGVFYFQRLLPGDYVIYAFSQYSDETPYPVFDTVSVTETGVIVDADTLRVRIKA